METEMLLKTETLLTIMNENKIDKLSQGVFEQEEAPQHLIFALKYMEMKSGLTYYQTIEMMAIIKIKIDASVHVRLKMDGHDLMELQLQKILVQKLR
jgi:hypothetical protein